MQCKNLLVTKPFNLRMKEFTVIKMANGSNHMFTEEHRILYNTIYIFICKSTQKKKKYIL